MIKNLILISLCSLICVAESSTVMAKSTETFSAGKMADDAPQELMHWGQLVGQWSTREESLKRDGSGWEPAKGADWDFFWAFDGWGIQDNYTSPAMSEKLEDESKRQRGINLRIYNTEEQQWVQTWLTPTSKKPQNFTATSSMDALVMLSSAPDARGNYRRITFFEMNDNRFKWKLEWSQDQVKWLEVYRIFGSKK